MVRASFYWKINCAIGHLSALLDNRNPLLDVFEILLDKISILMDKIEILLDINPAYWTKHDSIRKNSALLENAGSVGDKRVVLMEN